MALSVPGLKIENDKLYCYNDASNTWEEASVALIPALEELFKYLEGVIYPATSSKEDLILKDQYDIGTGKVMTYKDQDGDMQMTFEADLSAGFVINEDEAFGIPASTKQMAETEPINHWSNGIHTSRADVVVKNTDGPNGNKPTNDFNDSLILSDYVKKCKITETEERSDPVLKAQVAKKTTSKSNFGFPIKTRFKKRIGQPQMTEKGEVQLIAKKALLRLAGDTIKAKLSPSDLRECHRNMSFISMGYFKKPQLRKNRLLLGELRYNRITGKTGTLESKFYLEENTP